MTTVTRPDYDPASISPLSFWEQTARERDETFAMLRRERPVSWHPPVEGGLMPHDDAGLWAVTRHADIVEVSRHPETFRSGDGVMLEDVPSDFTDAASSFLVTDGDRHSRLRKLISSAFTPRQVARIEEQIAAQASRIVDELLEAGDGDFVAQVSRRLPTWTISEMMGVPPDIRADYVAAADGMVGWNDPVVRGDREPMDLLMESLMALYGISNQLAEARRANPADDLMSNLVAAEVDGTSLTDDEIASFFVLLAVAGNDTTRHTSSHGILALSEHPDQWRYLLEDPAARVPTAVEELLRWGSAVMTFRRTAAADTTLHGVDISEGDKVALIYSSGNRDEEVFDDPWRFDVSRDPNPHVTFGGGGAHFCLGASLARTQLRCLLTELLTRTPGITASDPQYLVSNFMHAVTALPCQLGSSRR